MKWKQQVAGLTKKRADTAFGGPMGDQRPDGLDGTNDGTTVTPGHITVAPFSPNQQSAAHRRNQSSVLIHQKSPLLLATPPQVTRALAYSHVFILPLNYLAGLLSWTTGDSWESFLLLGAFWLVVLYGDIVNRFAGPLVLVVSLMIGMYARRYNPLFTTAKKRSSKSGANRASGGTDSPEQRKTLDEILDTLQTFTNRCNVLLDPMLRLTEFLTTQTNTTVPTTRPALTTLFIRILLISPVWTALTLPPLRLLTTQRIVLVAGTLAISWHSSPARVTRAILWRSRAVRNLASLITGLNFAGPSVSSPPQSIGAKSTSIPQTASSTGLRFTFTIYENQRRWLGLGWTPSLMAYERQSWTDEQLHPATDVDHFVLPETDQEGMAWRWVDGEDWRVEGASDKAGKSSAGGDDNGWTYYDNKWHDALKADGWGRYTRRRKWVRAAELVDVSGGPTADAEASAAKDLAGGNANGAPAPRRRTWFGRRQTASDKGKAVDRSDAGSGSGLSAETTRSRDGPEEDVHTPIRFRQREWEREVGEGLAEGLG